MRHPRITIVPGLCGGRPTIRGMRIRVCDILDLMAGGMSHAAILRDFPYLKQDDLVACLHFAAAQAHGDSPSTSRILNP